MWPAYETEFETPDLEVFKEINLISITLVVSQRLAKKMMKIVLFTVLAVATVNAKRDLFHAECDVKW